ncbi:hypothetical protein WDW86_12500 [Bdellovibrionota bacterium FG-2]
MLNTTLQSLSCPRRKKGAQACGGSLILEASQERFEISEVSKTPEVFEIRSGTLQCIQCQAKYPILAGVAVVVENVRHYLIDHVKGISKLILEEELPEEFREEFEEAREDIQTEHIEEDLEAERVNALYVMTHYLNTQGSEWWKSEAGEGSPLIASLVKEHWDRGPFSQIKTWVGDLASKNADLNAVELGCGVGGLYPQLRPHLKSYLGVDSAFASIALARHMALGFAYEGEIKVPEDLLKGSVSRKIQSPNVSPKEICAEGAVDFVVGDFEHPPLQIGRWNLSIALNAIDMLDRPETLPRLQHELLSPRGIAIQSCPYIWHEAASRKLRARLPKGIATSSKAVEWLYTQVGFEIEKSVEHVPWLFFKHVRQLEIYSVHMFLARRAKA